MLTSKLAARIDEMEKKLESFQTLAGFTKMLKSATAEEVKEWMTVCNAAADSGEANAKTKTKAKAKKEANSPSLSDWNVFVKATWREMAAAKGVFLDATATDSEAAYKEFKVAANKEGVTYQAVMKEASRRKDEREGVDHAEKLAKKAAASEKRAEKKKATPPYPCG